MNEQQVKIQSETLSKYSGKMVANRVTPAMAKIISTSNSKNRIYSTSGIDCTNVLTITCNPGITLQTRLRRERKRKGGYLMLRKSRKARKPRRIFAMRPPVEGNTKVEKEN